MPNLVGLDPKYLVAATNAYKNGQRRNDMMKALVAGLAEGDISNIALFYAAQKPGKARTPAAGNVAAGKAAAAACVACHGEAGVSAGAMPSLAGQDAQYFVAAMRAYKDGSRTDPTMKGPASALSDAALTDLAAYYASLPPQPPKTVKALDTGDWVQRYDRCHGVNGNSIDPRVPALAAQRADYLTPDSGHVSDGRAQEHGDVGHVEGPDRDGNQDARGLLFTAESTRRHIDEIFRWGIL